MTTAANGNPFPIPLAMVTADIAVVIIIIMVYVLYDAYQYQAALREIQTPNSDYQHDQILSGPEHMTIM